MAAQKPGPAGEGGAGRACLAAGARSMLNPAAFHAQRLIARHHVDPALAAMVAALAFGMTAR